MTGFRALDNNSIAGLTEGYPMTVHMVLRRIHESTNPTTVRYPALTCYTDLVPHVICQCYRMEPILRDTPQEVEYLKRSLVLKLSLEFEQGAIMPHRQNLVLNAGRGIEIGNYILFSNSLNDKGERHCLKLKNLLGFSGTQVLVKIVKSFHDQQCL